MVVQNKIPRRGPGMIIQPRAMEENVFQVQKLFQSLFEVVTWINDMILWFIRNVWAKKKVVHLDELSLYRALPPAEERDRDERNVPKELLSSQEGAF